MNLYRELTPIENHRVAGRSIFVKRDDLYGNPPAPPLGKLRGLRAVLSRYRDRGVTTVGCWDTRVSRLGEGLAAACTEFPGMQAVVAFPTRPDGSLPPAIIAASKLGANLLPLRGNHVRICHAQARRRIEALGGEILPFGLECEEAVNAIAREAATLPRHVAGGFVFLSSGSGVTLAGLLRGLSTWPRRVIALSSGRSPEAIQRCVERFIGPLPRFVSIVPARVPYYAAEQKPCPFPAHPNYDAKAWHLMVERVHRIHGPVLFWNIGS